MHRWGMQINTTFSPGQTARNIWVFIKFRKTYTDVDVRFNYGRITFVLSFTYNLLSIIVLRIYSLLTTCCQYYLNSMAVKVLAHCSIWTHSQYFCRFCRTWLFRYCEQMIVNRPWKLLQSGALIDGTVDIVEYLSELIIINN